LRHSVWESYLQNDFDYNFLCKGIKEGFRIIDEGAEQQLVPCEVDNYQSCFQYAELVEKQIQYELSNGSYVATCVKPTIISALGAIPKSNSKVRLIHDASRPLHMSVNDYVQSDTSCSYMDLRVVSELISEGCYLAKIDLQSAYRSVPIHPSNYQATGLKWQFKNAMSPTYMYDTKLPFGASKSPQIFQRLSSAVCRILKKVYGYTAIAYLDDFLIFGKTFHECSKALYTLIFLLRELGFAINWSKVEGPSQQLVFLGVVVDSVSLTLALPMSKLQDFNNLLGVFSQKRRASIKQLETLIGKLNWASQVISGGRTFLRRVLDLKNSVSERHHKVLLTDDFFADLYWWISFMSIFNGTCRIQDPRPITSLQTDASSEGGGGYYNGDYFYINWPLDLPAFAVTHINVKEFTAIFLSVCRWCKYFMNRKVIIYCDNSSAVSWINKGTSRIPLVQFMCRILFWISAMFNCAISAKYLPGKQNTIGDACSRLHEPGQLTKLYSLVPSLQHDYFSIATLCSHMSLPFIFDRWIYRTVPRRPGSCFEKKGMG
jgi:hypothetical protein